jgi:MoaA/NifB/PqqE/SkfB family radical SAM enzyme
MSILTTTCEIVVFCSSSGHCQLDCSYCIVNPVIKRNPSITYEDLAYFLEATGKSTFFIFSGKGDFFAGYAKRDRFLERLLEHDVEVALDVNGILLQEYPELDETRRAKVRYVNLTLHYEQLRQKRLEKAWAANALTLIRLHAGRMNANTIFSPLEKGTWEESLAFYEREVFSSTGQKVTIVADCDRPFEPAEREECDRLKERFSGMIEEVYRADFENAFAGRGAVLCPAGRTYFRIWNDGRVQGCPYIPDLSDAGNLKERRLTVRERPFRCTTPKFCDCYDILQLGRMGFEEAPGPDLPALPFL